MKSKTITMKAGDQLFELSTSLRVAYNLQEMNNHKSYLAIFQDIDKMPLENQIAILYTAYVTANEAPVDKKSFTDTVLDNNTLMDVMDYIKQVISGITGKEIKDDKESETANTEKN